MSRTSSLKSALEDQRGSILIGGLLLVVAMTVIGVGLYQASVIETKQISWTETDVRGFYAADAGLHRAALDLADPDTTNPVGTLTFDAVKAANYASPTTLLPDYGSRCFGGATCDSSVTPYRPAYLVQAQQALDDTNGFWLISTSCTPGPASNPCPAGSRMAQVKARIHQTSSPGTPGHNLAFQGAAFGGSSLRITGNGTIDSYDSRLGGYGGSNVSSHGDIGSNGLVSASATSSLTIKGNVTNTLANSPTDLKVNIIGSNVNVQGNIQSGGTVLVNGMTNPNGQSGGNGTGGTAPQVTGTIYNGTGSPQTVMGPIPNCASFTNLTQCTSSSCAGQPGTITQYTDNTFTAIKATGLTSSYNPATGQLTLNGPPSGAFFQFGGVQSGTAPYCFGNVNINNSTIQVSTRTVFEVNGTFGLNSGSNFTNTTLNAKNLQIISTYGNDPGETGTGVSVTAGTALYATIYAPTTTATIGGAGTFYGGVMANLVNLSGSTGLHYDLALRDSSGLEDPTPAGPTTYALLEWKRVECGPSTFAC
jgi:hypothetical protein